MFNNSKYTKWYFNIVGRASTRILQGYVEKHHIIPKCLGGSNDDKNIIELTAREHFICHWLLTKMVDEIKPKYKLWNAFSCMLYRENSNQVRYKVNSKTFTRIKEQGAIIKSISWTGESNPMYGRRGELSPIFGRKQSASHIENSRKARLGIKRTEESKNKQRGQLKGIPKSEEHKIKTSESLRGEKNPMFGKKVSVETIAKRTATLQANRLAKKLAQGA